MDHGIGSNGYSLSLSTHTHYIHVYTHIPSEVTKFRILRASADPVPYQEDPKKVADRSVYWDVSEDIFANFRNEGKSMDPMWVNQQ